MRRTAMLAGLCAASSVASVWLVAARKPPPDNRGAAAATAARPRRPHGDYAVRLEAVPPYVGRILHRHRLAGPDHRGAGPGPHPLFARHLRARRAHRVAHPSARPDAPCPLRAWARAVVGRTDPRNPAGRRGVD